jgi:lipopolysaccharide export system protein LptC
MSWRAWLTLVLLFAAVATGWSLWRERGSASDGPAIAGRPDYVLHDFELIALDEQGRESFTLRAPRLARDPAARTMDLTTPVFVIPPRPGSDGHAWTVRSRTGWVSADGDELRLRGQVRADSVDAQGRPVDMRTEELNVFPDARRATSAVAVTLRQPGLILNGHHLEAQLDTKLVNLKDIKARYEIAR